MNVMFSCAGRRNYLFKFFKEILENKGLIIAGDLDEHASTLQEVDKAFKLPEIYNENFFSTLLEKRKKNNVELIIPLNDLELSLLAKIQGKFKESGIIPVISSLEVIDICFDKVKTRNFLEKIKIKLQKTHLSLEKVKQDLKDDIIKFPLIIKPRWDLGSLNMFYPKNMEQLELAYKLISSEIKNSILAKANCGSNEIPITIHEKIERIKYGVDTVNDLKGDYSAIFTKKKIGMRCGETDKTVTIKDERIKITGETIGKNLKYVENLDCDIFEKDGKLYVIDMNLKFGGHYPFAHIVGTNIPLTLIKCANNEIPDSSWNDMKSNIAFGKYDNVIRITKNVHREN